MLLLLCLSVVLCCFVFISISLGELSCVYVNSPNYLRDSIFLLLVALLDTCTNVISRNCD